MTETNTAPDLLERPCPFITFYSFKGGVGRSMALINVAGIVASRGFRVLVLDMDLEAPGLSFLANPSQPPAKHGPQPGIVDLLLDAVERGPEADMFASTPDSMIERYSAIYELPEGFRRNQDGALRIMPAGRLDDDYPRRLDRLDLPTLYREGTGLALITAFKQIIQESRNFDYVFVDSRTGFSAESGICTRDLADCLMIVSGLNKQNVEGTTRFLAALRNAVSERKPLAVILSPIPNGEDALVDEREQQARAEFSAAWGAAVQTDLHIPYHPQLALTEEPHIFRRRRGYLYAAYTTIERHLLNLLRDTWAEWFNLAADQFATGDYTESLASLRRAEMLGMPPGQWQYATWMFSLDRFASADADDIDSFLYERSSAEERRWQSKRLHHEAKTTSNRDLQDALFRRATRWDFANAAAHCDYGIFLWQVEKDLPAAKKSFTDAANVTNIPDHPELLRNYGGLNLAIGEADEGVAMIDRVAVQHFDIDSRADAQRWMYIFCCAPAERRPEALARLRTLILDHKITTNDWDFSTIIDRAVAMNHPEQAWLPTLAEVLAGRQPPDTLNDWPAWSAAAKP